MGLIGDYIKLLASRKGREATIAMLVIAFLAAFLAVYLRGLAWPLWLKYGVYIDAFDSWIEYWCAKYLYQHGIASWFDLKPPNKAVMIFWYPWGRDFTTSSYPLVPSLIALTYPLVSSFMSLEQWAAWIPPLSAGALVIIASWMMFRRFGLLAGITAAFLIALLPASADRTLLGFIEKEGVTLPFLILSIFLAALALEHINNDLKRRVYALAAGLATALVGLGWGGFLLPLAVVAISPLLLPAAGQRLRLKFVDLPLLAWIGFLPAALLSRFRGLNAIFLNPGGLFLASAALIALLAFLYELVDKRKLPRFFANLLENRTAYAIIALALLAIVFVAACLTGIIRSRVAYMLLPGALKKVVAARVGPLVESIAEHAANPHVALDEATPLAAGFAVLGLLYMLYRIIARGERGDIPLLLSAGLCYYAMFNAAYFIQLGGVFTAIAAAATTVMPLELAGATTTYGRGRASPGGLRIEFIAAVLLSLLLIGGAFAATAAKLDDYGSRLPLILGSSVTSKVVVPSWMKFLEFLRENTTKDTVAVAWWDYGYWLSVVGQRPSIADGATLNSTQISLLARILVGSYKYAPKILEKLHCKPGKTLIIGYGLYQFTVQGNRVLAILLPLAGDLPKSIWMVRIGGLPEKEYFGNGFNIQSRYVQDALLYRLLFQAPLWIQNPNVTKFVDPRLAAMVKGKKLEPCLGVVQDRHIIPYYLSGSARRLLEVPEGFKPAIVSAYPVTISGNSALVVIVAAFEWVGGSTP